MPSQVFGRGETIGKEYVVKRKIGEGQFSEVYEVEKASDSSRYALKIEKSRDVRTVKSELKVLQHLQGCRYVCKLHDSGSENGLYFFVMRLLGRNLAETIQRDYGGCAPLTDVKVLATGLLNALEGFHEEGFIHRDVKPANFALEDSTTSAKDGSWMLIDFGLARLYLDEKNEVLPPRQDAGFRGSTTYASLNAHEDKDLGRRDDLWSWFYVLVEMIEGTLPWRVDRGEITGATTTPAAAAATLGNLTAKESVEERKKECISHPERLFSKALPIPPVVKEINQYIAKLEFADKPSYSYLRTLLGKLDVESVVAVGDEKGQFAAPLTHHQDNNHNQNDRPLDIDATDGIIKPMPTRVPPGVEPRSRSLERKKENSPAHALGPEDRGQGRGQGLMMVGIEAEGGLLHGVVVAIDAVVEIVIDVIDLALDLGGISVEGAGAVRKLRMLQPAESLGIACLLIDELAAGVQGRQAELFGHLLEDIAGFAQVTATRYGSGVKSGSEVYKWLMTMKYSRMSSIRLRNAFQAGNSFVEDPLDSHRRQIRGQLVRSYVLSSSGVSPAAPPTATSSLARLPNHLAVIMDGNSRWAQQQGLPVFTGHQSGVDAMRRTVEFSCNEGIHCLTVFAFSSENWQRTNEEVEFLLMLIERVVRKELEILVAAGVNIKFIGDRSKLPSSLVEQMKRAEAATAPNSTLYLTVALSYSGRQDITAAVRNICHRVQAGEISPEEIDSELIGSNLALHHLPEQWREPDLILRTSGEQRLSNFLLWESAYSELHFSETLWPDFGERELKAAMDEYARRERRFGKHH
ncbi:putative Ditrans,polycis-undecaprenyl-diphosphate synthase [Nannochloris sp. 'desiccata']|nr:hypothetical protein KSW81_000689 [Chlorella desiccata (nom. nud.)]KAH7620659.1 putative Ditrans,polycis-undecaprenyl-diphosphate synthase [Chlorella desiccata (nom. nud.)]